MHNSGPQQRRVVENSFIIVSTNTNKRPSACILCTHTEVYREDHYGGYGKFGGKDYFELVSEMNPPAVVDGPPHKSASEALTCAADSSDIPC
jgi:hypothetical protein